MLQLSQGSGWLPRGHQLLFTLIQQFSKWDPWTSNSSITPYLLDTEPYLPQTCSLRPPGVWPSHWHFHKPSGPRWSSLDCLIALQPLKAQKLKITTKNSGSLRRFMVCSKGLGCGKREITQEPEQNECPLTASVLQQPSHPATSHHAPSALLSVTAWFQIPHTYNTAPSSSLIVQFEFLFVLFLGTGSLLSPRLEYAAVLS